MARQSSFGSLMVLALILGLLAAGMVMVLFAPNDHMMDKHADAAWLLDKTPSEGKCYENGEKVLHLFPFTNDCGRKKAGGVITTAEGDTITAFIADLAYWLKVLARDGYSAVQ